MNPLIIGLGYEQRSGKGEVAKLAKALGAKHLSFGYALKNEVMAWLTAYGVAFKKEHFYGSSADRTAILRMDATVLESSELSGLIQATDCGVIDGICHFSARRFLQYYGTEFRRAQNVDYWCNQTEADMHEMIIQGNQFIVFDDVRFLNEANVVKDNGGIMIRIDRDNRVGATAEGHSSDTVMASYNDWDCILNNNGSLEQLAAQFHHFIVPHLMERGILPWEEII